MFSISLYVWNLSFAINVQKQLYFFRTWSSLKENLHSKKVGFDIKLCSLNIFLITLLCLSLSCLAILLIKLLCINHRMGKYWAYLERICWKARQQNHPVSPTLPLQEKTALWLHIRTDNTLVHNTYWQMFIFA